MKALGISNSAGNRPDALGKTAASEDINELVTQISDLVSAFLAVLTEGNVGNQGPDTSSDDEKGDAADALTAIAAEDEKISPQASFFAAFKAETSDDTTPRLNPNNTPDGSPAELVRQNPEMLPEQQPAIVAKMHLPIQVTAQSITSSVILPKEVIDQTENAKSEGVFHLLEQATVALEQIASENTNVAVLPAPKVKEPEKAEQQDDLNAADLSQLAAPTKPNIRGDQPVTTDKEIDIDDTTGQVTMVSLPPSVPANTGETAKISEIHVVHHQGEAPPVAEQLASVIAPLKTGEDGSHQLMLALHPKELGTVRIQVQVHKDEVTVHLHADSAETVETLRESLSDLRTELETSGLHAGSLDVQTGDAEQFTRQFQHSGRSQEINTDDDVLQEIRELAQQLKSSSDLDIRM
jgi:flagellar hook-length control protein FliK